MQGLSATDEPAQIYLKITLNAIHRCDTMKMKLTHDRVSSCTQLSDSFCSVGVVDTSISQHDDLKLPFTCRSCS